MLQCSRVLHCVLLSLCLAYCSCQGMAGNVDPPVQEPSEQAGDTDSDKLAEEIKRLKEHLESREKYITLLESEIDTRDAKINALKSQMQQQETQMVQKDKLLVFQKSLTELQEHQIAKFKELIKEQKAQINQLLGLGSEP